MKWIFTLPTFFIIIFYTYSQSQGLPNNYFCQKINDPVSIDGRIEEDVWNQATWSSDFMDILGDRGSKPTYKTKVKMLWDDNYLYVAAMLEEPDIWATLHSRDDIIPI